MNLFYCSELVIGEEQVRKAKEVEQKNPESN